MSNRLPIVAIVGRANVGKSSLFNRLVDRRQAIVANEPGTTRDSVQAKVSSRKGEFWIVDTAGLKTPDDDFEFTIQEQIKQATDSADLIVVLVDASGAISEEDRRVAKLALKSKKPVILGVNKIDKTKQAIPEGWERLGIKERIGLSAAHNIGTDELVDAVTANIPSRREEDDPNRLKIALIGRPNVGKSSLFNTLAKKQQAIVADVAGTTRDVNRTLVRYHQREVELLDTAGIRRPGKIGTGVEHFSVIRALSAIEESDVCLLLIDVNELGVHLDQKLAGMIKDSAKPIVLVISKWDSADKDAYTRDYLAKKLALNFQHVPWAPLVFTSSVTGQNVTKLLDLASELHQRAHIKFTTSELNNWLREAAADHPPAGLKNTQPKLRYVTQVGEGPIRLRVFGRDTKFLHWSYKRFLERRLRELRDLSGVPVILEFSDNEDKREHSN